MQYSEQVIQAVWEKARGIPNWDNNQWRMDQCGAWIQRQHFNDTASQYGWSIQNVAPGRHEVNNLQPFHWKNTYDITNHKAHCRATADNSGVSPTFKVGEPRNSLE